MGNTECAGCCHVERSIPAATLVLTPRDKCSTGDGSQLPDTLARGSFLSSALYSSECASLDTNRFSGQEDYRASGSFREQRGTYPTRMAVRGLASVLTGIHSHDQKGCLNSPQCYTTSSTEADSPLHHKYAPNGLDKRLADNATTVGSVTSSPKLGSDIEIEEVCNDFSDISFQLDTTPVLGEGMYLTFSPVASGSMYLNWSREAVPNALCYGKPATSVPNFRYNTAQRKQELSCGIQRTKTGLAAAWCSFLKMARQHQSTVWLLPAPNAYPIHVFLMKRNNKIIKLLPNRRLTLTSDIIAVAAVPQPEVFLGISQMDAIIFLQQAGATEGGWGLNFG